MSNVVVMNKPYNDSLALDAVMGYCAGETVEWDKCNFYGGMGVNTSSTLSMINDMKYVKMYKENIDGRQLCHFVINIVIPVPKGVRKDQSYIRKEQESCPLIAKDISTLIWNKGYQNSVFNHIDTDKSHLHFVINTVNYVTGNKISNIAGLANEILYFLRKNYGYLAWKDVVFHKGEDEEC